MQVGDWRRIRLRDFLELHASFVDPHPGNEGNSNERDHQKSMPTH